MASAVTEDLASVRLLEAKMRACLIDGLYRQLVAALAADLTASIEMFVYSCRSK